MHSRRPPSIKRHRIEVTTFKNTFATSLEVKKLSLPEMLDLVMGTARSTKAKLPLWKLGQFGDVRSDKGNSLRHDGNMLAITGIEMDYDAEQMPFDEAVEILKAMKVRGLVYASPSHTAAAPRWRVMLPTSKPLPVAMRTALVERVNKAFGGIFASESKTLSQSFYYGRARDNDAPDHRGEVLDGIFIDQLGDLPVVPDNVMTHPTQAETLDPERERRMALAKLFQECRARPVDDGPHGFDGHIACIGDGESLDGFNGPLTRAAAAYAHENGANFSRAELKRRLRQAINDAPKKATRKPADIKRYLSDSYLDDTIDSAVRKFAPVEELPTGSMIRAEPFALRDPKLIPKRQWLYGRHLIRKFGAATIANGGVGKSSLLIAEALAMVTGKPLLGIQVKKRLRVWLWNGEDPLEELERRIAAACKYFGIKASEIAGRLFVNSGRDCEIIIATQTRDGAKIG